MKDIFLRKRVLRSPGRLQRHYDVVIVGGGSHGLVDRLLPREASRDHERRHPREELHRLRRGRPEHDDHPRELPHARGRGVLQGERRALRDALGRARLQPHVLAARALHARALRPLAGRAARAGGGEQAARDLEPRDRPARGEEALPADQHRRGRDLADPRRALPPAGRDHPPRRRRVGLREAGRPRGDRHPPGRRGDRVRRPGRPLPRRADDEGRHLAATSSSARRPAGRARSRSSPGSGCRSRPRSCRRSSPSR